MTTTTMHFGPEWMRPKHASRPQNPPSPPPNPSPPSGVSSYSALLTPSPNNIQEPSDSANPFLYSKEDLLKIYKDGGRRGLGLDVERWEGVVREVGSEPVALKEWTEGERKLFAGSINSEVRRRQSSDYLSLATQSGERQKLSHTGPGVTSPLRERFGGLMRKRDGTDQPALTIPRKLSLSSAQGPLGSPRDGSLPSPRTRGPVAPSFDGILNSGETWVSRRRASESGTRLNSGATRGDGDTEPQSGNRLKIDEVEEEQQRHSESRPDSTDKNPPQNSGPSSGESPQGATIPVNDSANSNGPDGSSTFHGVTQPPAQGSMDSLPAHSSANPVPVTAASQHVANLASVEWSYLDPQGQVQGPFQSELMQKWYEEGYFAMDLLMRRVNLDEDWTPVGELAQRAGSERIFFFNFDAPAAPPGLSRRLDPSRDFQQQLEPNGYNAPYQPVPTRTVHPNLDSYFASSSPASNSPSSSFGAGRFGNNSPDPAAFGGLVRAPISSNDSPINLRPGTFTDPTFIGTRRTGYADAPFEQGFATRAGIGNVGPTRTSSVDSYGLNSSIPSQPPWGSSTSVHSPSLNTRASSYDHMGPGPFASHLGSGLDTAYSGESSLTRGLTAQQDVLGQNFGNVNQRDLSRLGSRDVYQLEHHAGIGLGGFDGPGGSPFESPVQQQPFNQSPTNFAPPVSQQASSPPVIAPTSTILASIPPTMPPPQSTWPEATESAPKRSGLTPFDNTAFPTSRNTTATRTAPPPPAQSWTAIQKSTSGDSSQSPWSSASQGIVEDGWGHVPGPHSLTVSNLTQHTQQQESGEDFSCENAVTVDSPVEPTALPEHVQPPIQSPSIPGPAEPPQQPRRPIRKFSVQTNIPQPATPTTPTSAITQPTKEPTPSSSTVSAPTKPVWSTEDEKNKSTGGPTSLREIQEMEAKKQEARKAAERERARASVAAAAVPSEDPQTFTASWGLPTSQVGAKTPSKETVGGIVPSSSSMSPMASSAVSAQSTPAAVWTNAQKPATKKSMRDILEEEERRKKAAAKDLVASAAARRAYAESTNKATPAVTGGAWTTVGANGKTAAAALATPSVGRPPIPPSTGSAAVPSRGSGTASTVRSPAPPAKVISPPKVDDTPVAPSPDFMKWLNDSLKQLNSSVNYEEIASMLLSFPLDGDATTVEIISELIYDNSTTLDGRRFAQEFIAKRKADAASRKPSGRAPSIADVVKAQPKPSQQAEWGGFKVVKQKKKGGRS